MRSRKEARSLLPGVRRLRALLADEHRLVVLLSLDRENSDARKLQPTRD
jgi:hypothetical protein